jgi:hypothetical protein
MAWVVVECVARKFDENVMINANNPCFQVVTADSESVDLFVLCSIFILYTGNLNVINMI